MRKSVALKFEKQHAPDWKEILSGSIFSAEQLSRNLPVDVDRTQRVVERYPMRINPYYLSLIREEGDPIWRQAVPDLREIEDDRWAEDPFLEEVQSPVPNLVRRYPDRVLFLVSNQCAMYCRYCMRKRRVGNPFAVTDETVHNGIEYIRRHSSVRDVVLSGGDPLLLEDEVLKSILKHLRKAPHVEIIRIHTRVPCTLPQRVAKTLAQTLRKFHPIFINIHFNHPEEITAEATEACAVLADAGIPLGCQTVLLKGVNDDPMVMRRLFQKLLRIRVKPYYLHHPDPVKGTGHFRTSVEDGLKIMKAVLGHTSGLCVPHYMIDLPGGGGKVPLVPEYLKCADNGELIVQNYKGELFNYPVK